MHGSQEGVKKATESEEEAKQDARPPCFKQRPKASPCLSTQVRCALQIPSGAALHQQTPNPNLGTKTTCIKYWEPSHCHSWVTGTPRDRQGVHPPLDASCDVTVGTPSSALRAAQENGSEGTCLPSGGKLPLGISTFLGTPSAGCSSSDGCIHNHIDNSTDQRARERVCGEGDAQF